MCKKKIAIFFFFFLFWGALPLPGSLPGAYAEKNYDLQFELPEETTKVILEQEKGVKDKKDKALKLTLQSASLSKKNKVSFATLTKYSLNNYFSAEIGKASPEDTQVRPPIQTEMEPSPFLTNFQRSNGKWEQVTPFLNVTFMPVGENTFLSPYVGAGAGLAYSLNNEPGNLTPITFINNGAHVAFNGMIGVNFMVHDQLSFGMRYQRLWLGLSDEDALKNNYISLRACYSF